MRVLPLLLAFLVALAPISVAQEDDGDSAGGSSSSTSTSGSTNSTTSSSTASGRPDQSDPQRPACPPGPNATEPQRRDCAQAACREAPSDERCRADRDPRVERWCRGETASSQRLERCRALLQQFRDGELDDDGDDDDHWVTFSVDPENLTLLDMRVAGRLTLWSLRLDPGAGEAGIDRHGRALRIGDNDTELLLHDDPTGLLRFKGADGSAVLTFPNMTAETRDHGARIVYEDGREGLLVAENLTWIDASTVRVWGFWTYHVPARGVAAPAEPPRDPESAAQVHDAIERRHVAAEVNLRLPRASDAQTLAGDDPAQAAANASVEVLAYDDVEVEVDHASLADPDVPIRIVVSSELPEGRTLVFNLEDELVSDPDGLRLRYFDLHDQADGSTLETEVVLSMASSLLDVLDPTDDGGQPEYWIVEDADGTQVLFSVPHWSAHAITIQSLGVSLPPNVAYGIIGGAVAAVSAAVVMFRPKRRDDDDGF